MKKCTKGSEYMKILVVNPIMYTSETRKVQKRKSLVDTMAIGLCTTFKLMNNDVVLYTCDEYKPSEDEKYPFDVVFDKAKYKKIFPVNKFIKLKGLKKYLKNHNFDLIICSECFQMTTFDCVKSRKKGIVIWQELAAHNRMMKTIPSRIWYSFVVRFLFRKITIVARSENAKKFISKYSKNVSEITIGHGVYTEFFQPSTKDDQFIVSSQLIKRKRVDKILEAFSDFIKNDNFNHYKLIICGDGPERKNLENMTVTLNIEKNVEFLGKLPHSELIKVLSRSKAMLIKTIQDNNMISITESLACGTPVITTSVPYNSYFIKKNVCGIVRDDWNYEDLIKICESDLYIKNCLSYRDYYDYSYKVRQFLSLIKQ